MTWILFNELYTLASFISECCVLIAGFYAPCSHSQVSNHLTVLSESLPSELNEASLIPEPSRGNRNRCSVPGILYNTNTVESFHALDKHDLLKKEAAKVDIIFHSVIHVNSTREDKLNWIFFISIFLISFEFAFCCC